MCYLVLRGKLITVTSLHIIYEDIPSVPEIPAYLLRARMRALLEIYHGLTGEGKFHKCSDGKCFLCSLFGSSFSSGLVVKNGVLSGSYKLFPWEIKRENGRFVRRVPPGISFDLEFILRFFRKEDNEHGRYIFEAFDLIENDYIGADGSRGAGKVKFCDFYVNLKHDMSLPPLPSGWKYEETEEIAVKNLVRL